MLSTDRRCKSELVTDVMAISEPLNCAFFLFLISKVELGIDIIIQNIVMNVGE